jgi:succinate dehydrogenase / fumarate reductase, cytochrome b subunit
MFHLKDNRPVYLDLFRIHLPVMGIVSLLHRLSGVLMFLAIPLAAWLLDLSVASPQDFDHVLELLSHPLMKLVQLLLLASLAHHLFAGIRFLLIDFDIGVTKPGARLGSWLVLAAVLAALTLFVAVVWL